MLNIILVLNVDFEISQRYPCISVLVADKLCTIVRYMQCKGTHSVVRYTQFLLVSMRLDFANLSFLPLSSSPFFSKLSLHLNDGEVRDSTYIVHAAHSPNPAAIKAFLHELMAQSELRPAHGSQDQVKTRSFGTCLLSDQ